MSQPTNGTVGAYSRWLITGLGLSRRMQSKSSDSSNASTVVTSTRAAASAWRFASGWWSSTAAAFGLRSLLLVEDQPSASPYPRAPDSNPIDLALILKPIDPEPRTVLLVEDNPTDAFVIKELIDESGLNLRLHIARNGHDALMYLQSRPERP